MDHYLHLVEVTRLRLMLALTAVALSLSALRTDDVAFSIRRHKLGRHGELHLTVPPSWSDRVGRTSIGLVITGDLAVYAELHASGPGSSAEQRTLEILKSATHLKPGGKD